MTFTHGTVARLFCGGYDISKFLSSVSWPISVDTVEVTTLGKVAKTYVPTLRDATLSGEGFFDANTTNATAIDDVMSAALQASRIWMYLPEGADTFGAVALSMVASVQSYEVSSEVSSAVAVALEAQGSGGTEMARVLHPLSTETVVGAGSTFDNGASSANGGVIYIIATFAGVGAINVGVEGSNDANAWGLLAPVHAVPSAGRTAVRIAISGSVPRYVRAVWEAAAGGSPPFLIAFYRG